MPFIPHTPEDVAAMLQVMGAASIDQLFGEIPGALRNEALPRVPQALNEMELMRLAQERAAQDRHYLSFLGAGAYEHHIPAAVWQLASRGEFYSAYTPYQAEASQGTLQVLYEWQSMMASLTALDVSNASLYDGASALAEAILMAVRAHKTECRRVLVPASLHPYYRAALQTLVTPQHIEIVEIPFDAASGRLDRQALERAGKQPFAALVINQPNFFGVLDEPDALTDWAHAQGMLVIGVCNPLALALIRPPGEWGKTGADIACGEAQPFGIPLSGGGPYLGYLCCRQEYTRQMPGRIAGRTLDVEGNPGFTLTLQAREQHIRRAKATSNICTNQGLMVTASTIHLALLGLHGVEQAAAASHGNCVKLSELLTRIPGVQRAFDAPCFHETVLRLPQPPQQVLAQLQQQGILGGLDLSAWYPELGNAMLICATETKTAEDLQQYASALAGILEGMPC